MRCIMLLTSATIGTGSATGYAAASVSLSWLLVLLLARAASLLAYREC